MLPRKPFDGIQIILDVQRLVAKAGLLLTTTLPQHLGLRGLVDHHLDLDWRAGEDRHGSQSC